MSRKTFQETIATAIDRSDKSQKEIAEALGYTNSNMITMFKKGTTRVPFPKVAVLAIELDLDPVRLVRAWLAAYKPEDLPVLDLFFCPAADPSAWAIPSSDHAVI